MRHKKKSVPGRIERLGLLRELYPQVDDAVELTERKRLGAAFDDVIDAFVALWTAERIVRKRAVVLPANAETDEAGLRMEIVA